MTDLPDFAGAIRRSICSRCHEANTSRHLSARSRRHLQTFWIGFKHVSFEAGSKHVLSYLSHCFEAQGIGLHAQEALLAQGVYTVHLWRDCSASIVLS